LYKTKLKKPTQGVKDVTKMLEPYKNLMSTTDLADLDYDLRFTPDDYKEKLLEIAVSSIKQFDETDKKVKVNSAKLLGFIGKLNELINSLKEVEISSKTHIEAKFEDIRALLNINIRESKSLTAGKM